MKAKIIDVYDERKDGRPNVWSTGTKYLSLRLRIIEGDETGEEYYDNFNLLSSCYWKFENLFNALGLNAPAFEQINKSVLELLKGHEINISTGKNKKGWKEVFKYHKKPVEIESNKVEEPKPEPKKTDPDLDEDIPF